MTLPARLALLVAVLALMLLLVSGPGVRLELWDFRSGFSLMRWAAYAGLAAAALAVITLLVPRWRRAGATLAAVALLVGLGTAYVPWSAMSSARAVPPIHDITTDTADPPEFVALLPLRQQAPNGADYAGEEIASQQRDAYPYIQPLQIDLPPAKAFEQALATAQGMGWEIVASDVTEGRIEATATTTWFGFKDDVVVRVRAQEAGSRVDLRSMSRVGRSDAGANAARIRQFVAELKDQGRTSGP